MYMIVEPTGQDGRADEDWSESVDAVCVTNYTYQLICGHELYMNHKPERQDGCAELDMMRHERHDTIRSRVCHEQYVQVTNDM